MKGDIMKKVLSIAGSDSSGGAGIQADLKTILSHKMYGMTAITALTAQNTTGVYGISEVTPEFLANQLDCIFTDIYPDAVKIGMVSNPALIEVITEKLTQYKAKNIVVDPVMTATSGSLLSTNKSVMALVKKLIPIADIITPNLSEGGVLCQMEIHTDEKMMEAAKKLGESYNGYILMKGGHSENNANDLLVKKEESWWIEGNKIDNPNTHGTGCTLSSAIACNLAAGLDMLTAVTNAKHYITGAIGSRLNLGKGDGPLDHGYWLSVDK